MAPSGLTVKEMLYQQDDFLRLHMWTLCVAMKCCIHETPRCEEEVHAHHPATSSKRRWEPYKKNSPSTMSPRMTYQIWWAVQVKKIDIQFAGLAKQYESCVGTPGYKGLYLRMYVVTYFFNPFNWLISSSPGKVEGLPYSGFPLPIYEYDPLRDGPVVSGWYARMKSMGSSIDSSIAFGNRGWWSKKGKKWVFKECSREALFTDFGVRVLYWFFEISSFVADEKNWRQCTYYLSYMPRRL